MIFGEKIGDLSSGTTCKWLCMFLSMLDLLLSDFNGQMYLMITRRSAEHTHRAYSSVVACLPSIAFTLGSSLPVGSSPIFTQN